MEIMTKFKGMFKGSSDDDLISALYILAHSSFVPVVENEQIFGMLVTLPPQLI